MNLPQRKKSAEEIAKLREELGVFAQPPAPQATGTSVAHPAAVPPAAPELPAASIQPPVSSEPDFLLATPPEPSALPAVQELPAPGISPLPSAPPRGPKPVTSLRRSERIPILPVSSKPDFEISPESGAPVVKSLRKSEQGPSITPKPAASQSSHLPAHRHSDQDLNTLRQQAAIAARMTPPPPNPLAPLPVVILGYLAPVVGVVCTWFDVPLAAATGCLALSLLIALFILLKKRLSRHHAAFIFIVSFFFSVFGAFHYFPSTWYVP